MVLSLLLSFEMVLSPLLSFEMRWFLSPLLGFYPCYSHLRWDSFYPLCSIFIPAALIWDELVFIPSVLIWDKTVFIPTVLIWDGFYPYCSHLRWDAFTLAALVWDEMVLSLLLVWDEMVLSLLLAWDEIVLSLLFSFEMRRFLFLLYKIKGCELTLFLNCNGELQILRFRSVFFSTCYMCCALLLSKVMTSYSRFSRQKSIRMKCLWAHDFLFVSYFFY